VDWYFIILIHYNFRGQSLILSAFSDYTNIYGLNFGKVRLIVRRPVTRAGLVLRYIRL
jgi:hypothetical protein